MKNITCLECQNDVELEEERKYSVGDVVECPFCGTEMEVVDILDDGELVVEEIAEEK